MNHHIREIKAYKHYFEEFYMTLPKKIQEKFVYVFRLIQTELRISEKFLKHIEGVDGLYEMRVMVGNDIFRVFCCFDKGNLVILLNGFQKKTQKTPKQELIMAERLMNEYFEEQKNK